MRARWQLTPEKYEVWDGKLLSEDRERLVLLALLLPGRSSCHNFAVCHIFQ